MDLQTAAARLGVHYQTAYRWVRDGSLPAVKRRGAYEVAERDVERFRSARAAPAPPPRHTHVRSWPHQADRLFDLLASGDELAARHLVERIVEGGNDPVSLCEHLFSPALRRIGDAWASGELSVAEEHRAAAIVERLLARAAVHPRGRPRGVCLVGTPVGEAHALPAAMAAVALRTDRWQVHHLGTEVPQDDLVELTRRVEAELAVLSVTVAGNKPRAEEVGARISSATGARVLVGEPGARLADLLAQARRL